MHLTTHVTKLVYMRVHVTVDVGLAKIHITLMITEYPVGSVNSKSYRKNRPACL